MRRLQSAASVKARRFVYLFLYYRSGFCSGMLLWKYRYRCKTARSQRSRFAEMALRLHLLPMRRRSSTAVKCVFDDRFADAESVGDRQHVKMGTLPTPRPNIAISTAMRLCGAWCSSSLLARVFFRQRRYFSTPSNSAGLIATVARFPAFVSSSFYSTAARPKRLAVPAASCAVDLPLRAIRPYEYRYSRQRQNSSEVRRRVSGSERRYADALRRQTPRFLARPYHHSSVRGGVSQSVKWSW